MCVIPCFCRLNFDAWLAPLFCPLFFHGAELRRIPTRIKPRSAVRGGGERGRKPRDPSPAAVFAQVFLRLLKEGEKRKKEDGTEESKGEDPPRLSFPFWRRGAGRKAVRGGNARARERKEGPKAGENENAMGVKMVAATDCGGVIGVGGKGGAFNTKEEQKSCGRRSKSRNIALSFYTCGYPQHIGELFSAFHPPGKTNMKSGAEKGKEGKN